ncbi:MAG TPA: ATP-binding protein, partial [Phototrophicaceae bacterium]|nr:ATP-binding protein [Phototrophicaceae bacterium]
MLIEMNRIAHSMKGAARAVGLNVIEKVSHDMEEVFSAALRNRIRLTPDTCDTLYDGLDLIQILMDGEETTEDTLAEVLERLGEIVARSTGTDSQIVAVVPVVTTTQTDTEDDDDIDKDEGASERPGKIVDRRSTGEITVTPIAINIQPAREIPERRTTSIPVVEAQTLSLRPVEETVRVTVSKLDRLMAEATELLVARMHGEMQQRLILDLRRKHSKWQREWRSIRTAYIRLVRRIQDNQETVSPELAVLLKFLEINQRYLLDVNRHLAQFAQTLAQDNMHLATLADQLQDDIGAMRLIPFDFIVSGFQRTVRDLAREMDKQIQLEINGAAVEIDKTVLDALKDPLIHLIRNAIDHGIEKPTEREHLGKSPTGLIRVEVEQRGSEMMISVSDDGRGIDLQRIRRTIVKQKLMSETEAQLLSDDEARFYIFHPGFTTIDKVTAISGRGMGMDIVRDRVESLRGRINIHSEANKGTIIRLNIPVSLTRIRCILVRIGDQEYAVPSVVVSRMMT